MKKPLEELARNKRLKDDAAPPLAKKEGGRVAKKKRNKQDSRREQARGPALTADRAHEQGLNANKIDRRPQTERIEQKAKSSFHVTHVSSPKTQKTDLAENAASLGYYYQEKSFLLFSVLTGRDHPYRSPTVLALLIWLSWLFLLAPLPWRFILLSIRPASSLSSSLLRFCAAFVSST